MEATSAAWRLDFAGRPRLDRVCRPAVTMGEALQSVDAKAPREAEEAPDAATLIERCKAGDRQAFRELYQQHRRQVVSQLAYLVPRADVEDVLQEVFVEVFRSIRRFEGRSAFSTWLYRVVVHLAMKSRRKAGRSHTEPSALEVPEQPDPAEGPQEKALTRERLARAEALLAELAPKKRAVLVLHDMRGMDAARIAEITGTNIMTVRTRLFYARREFEQLAAEDPALAELFAEDTR